MDLSLLALGAVGMAGAGATAITSFEDASLGRVLWGNNATYAQATSWSSDGLKSLQVDFKTGTVSTGVTYNTTLDLRNYSALTFDAMNTSATMLEMNVMLTDSLNRQMMGTIQIDPNSTGNYTLVFQQNLLDAQPYGIAAFPNPFTDSVTFFARPVAAFDLGNIRKITFTRRAPTTTAFRIFLDDLVLRPLVNVNTLMTGATDRYGQFNGSWRGKILTDGDLIESQTQDIALSGENTKFGNPFGNRGGGSNSLAVGTDIYGGSTNLPKQTATGAFRTQKIGTKWWFVSPLGNPFYSLGVTSVRTEAFESVVTNRTTMFGYLPTGTDPLADHLYTSGSWSVLGQTVFNAYTANLERGLGQNWASLWKARTLDRLNSWGFNTLGNGTDTNLFQGNNKLSYTLTLNSTRLSTPDLLTTSRWGAIKDPFAPTFATALNAEAVRVMSRYQGDSWLLGVFVDNELPWAGESTTEAPYYLARMTLNKSGSSVAAKAALYESLKKKYVTVGRLNLAWGSRFVDWNAVRSPFKLTTLNAAASKDYSEMEKMIARKYFEASRAAVKQAIPSALYLGARFAWYSKEALAASDEFADVNSFNIYQRTVDRANYGVLDTLTKPTMISEFNFLSRDSGLLGSSGTSVSSQAMRGKGVEDYMSSVFGYNNIIGAHWYKWGDDPATGRSMVGSAESYNNGLVSISDRPYDPLVAAWGRVSANKYLAR